MSRLALINELFGMPPNASEHEKAGKNEDTINQTLFRRQVHEDGGNKPSLEGCDEECDGHVCFLRAEIHIGEGDSDGGEGEERCAHHQISANVAAHLVRIFLGLVFDW